MTTIAQSVGTVTGAVARRIDRLSDHRFALLTFLPAIVVIGIFLIPPIVSVFGLSLFRIELVKDTDTPFIGLGNFERMLRDRDFLASIPRTIVLTVAMTALSVPLALFTALLLNRLRRGAAILGVALLLPWAIAPVVTGQFWQFIFHSHFGVLTGLANMVGLVDGPIRWLEDTTLAMGVAVLATSWRVMPILALILLAALKTIPDSLYRAVRMDGAGSWSAFRHVTLPGIATSVLLVTVLAVILSLQIFDVLFALTGGGPGRDTTVSPYYIWLRAFQNLSLGYSAAMAVVLIGIVVAISLVLVFVRFRDRGTAVEDEELTDPAAGAVRASHHRRIERRPRPPSTFPAGSHRRRRRVPGWLGRAGFLVASGALLFWLLAPIAWILIASLQTEKAITTVPPALSLMPNLEWYAFLLGNERWYGSLAVSLQVAILTMLITILLAAVAAYPLARVDFRRKGIVLGGLAFTQMIPAVVMAIPVLILFNHLRLRDSVAGLVLVNVAFLVPLVIWLIRNYIAEVPLSVEAAARMDGCSRLGTLFRVTLRAAAPGIAAVAILIVIGTWNEFLFARVLGDREAVTITRRITDLQSLSSAYGVIYSQRAAAGILAVLPALALVLLFHRRIVGGLTQGFMKG